VSIWINLYIKYDTLDGLSEALVFYPLHYEPEASILYMSEFYEDQPALIRNLAKCISRNQVLVVKEHPQQAGILLTKKFQNLKKSISNLVFLPAEFSTKEVLKKSELIITQTSTAGFEGLIMGKPVFVLGKVFYNNFRNINRVESFEKLRLQIRKRSYLIPQSQELKEDLAAFVHVTQVGNIYFNPQIYDPQNLLNIAKAITTKLEEITLTGKDKRPNFKA
jgi:capsule polysaccharide modification protein KpsS